MAAPVKVSFQIAGARDLMRTFDSIEKRVQKLAKAEAKVARATETAARKKTNAAAKAAKAAEKASTDSLRKQAQAEQAHARRIEAIKARSAAMAGRYAAKAAAAEMREMQKVKASRVRMGLGAAGAVGRAGRSTLGTAAGVAGGLGMTAGTMAIGSALTENIRLREQAAFLVNATRNRRGETTQDAGDLTGFAQRMSTQYGVSATEVMTGLGTVAERAGGAKGLKAARKDWEDLTKTAVAYDTSMEDLGAVTAAALNAGVKPGKEMRDVIEAMVAMGQEGSLEFKNLGAELPKLMGAARATEMSGASGIREMVALAQLAVDSTVSAEEARTAVARSIDDMGMKAPMLRKAGVQVFGESGKVRRTRDLIPDILAAAERDPSKFGKGVKTPTEALMKVFGVRSKKMTSALADVFMKAGGGERGKEAVRAKIADISGAKLRGRDDALATVMGTEANQLKRNFNAFKVEIGKLLPQFSKLLPQLMKATQGFAKLAVWVGENPFKGLGALFAAKLTSELAAAAIPKVLESGLKAAMSASYGGTGAGTLVGSKALGAPGAGVAITAAAVTITAAGVQLIDQASAKGEKAGKDVFATSVEATNLMSKAKHGKLTEEERAKLAKHGKALETYGQRSAFGAVGEVAGGLKATDMLNNAAVYDKIMQFFSESSKESQGLSAEEAKAQSEQIAAMLAKAAKASETIATNLSNGANSTRSGKPVAR